ncbi:helix-turn-helix transcriptional regulator [Eilatimonas milleporae]|uniref:Xre family transcriptional regulator n=1 Tax=Eilatimonas milleporae TaxID=911205 RepID=A0A3M0BZL1_9PROT|nr:helix-turn-helix transcriptional regulator [Eilatimonas milleporae]RMB02025.1 Xre family transcriptional regulator [Eilatimonas milleporae]
MPKKRLRRYTKITESAVALLGELIQLGRKRRGFSEAQLAERAGVSRATIQRIEKGSMTSEIGLVFELAGLVGIPLFGDLDGSIESTRESTRNKIALLPSRIRESQDDLKDDF